jgi:hypothetical protein
VRGCGLGQGPDPEILPAGTGFQGLDIVPGRPFLDEGQGLVDPQAVPAVVEVGRAVSLHLLDVSPGRALGHLGSARGVHPQVLSDKVFVEGQLLLLQGRFDLAEERLS